MYKEPFSSRREGERIGGNSERFGKGVRTAEEFNDIWEVEMNRMIGSYVWSVLKDLKEYFPKTMIIRQGFLLFFVIKDKMVSLHFYE